MKGKINLKTIIIFVIMILIGVLGLLGVNTVRTYMAGASADVAPQGIAAAANEDGRGAVVSWKSDKPTMGVVEYGTTPASLLLRAVESEAVVDHKLSLSPLKPNVTYYFRVRVGEEIFDNNGIPYSFKTEGEEMAAPTVAVQPSLVPTIVPSTASPGATTTTCDRKTDFNKDGVVNSIDYLECIKSGGSSSSASGGSSLTPTAAASGDCSAKIDFDGNGVVNSLDRIKCLQSAGE